MRRALDNPEPTLAEILIEDYNNMHRLGKLHHGVVPICIMENIAESGITFDTAMARLKVVIDFSKQSLCFKLRAIVEGWDGKRLNKEMY